MAHPYDKRFRGRDTRQVPLQVAREIAAERDRLVEALERARRENDELLSGIEALQVENEALEHRAHEAEREAEEVRRELVEAASARAEDADHHPEMIEAEVAARLRRRVEELTKDLERVQRRTSDTVQDARREERVRVLAGLGDVLDSVERALEMGASGPWQQGLEAIREQLYAFFRGENARVLGVVGEAMDPRIHEAVERIDHADVAPGHVVDVVRHGIELEDGTVVRPAQVCVAA